jgi:HEAT repeat protein
MHAMNPHATKPSLCLLARAVVFAVAVAASGAVATAQGEAPADPRAELAAVLAVEEQQGDLAAAERLYRERLAGAGLSPAARALANARLGALLQRLGRTDDAKPFLAAAAQGGGGEAAVGAEQDRAREAELGEQARKLLPADDYRRAENVDGELRRALLWIGEPAVPALVAQLAQARASKWQQGERVADLAGLVWQIGGAKAAAYLREALADPEAPMWLVGSAGGLQSPAMLAVAEEALTHPNVELVGFLLRGVGERVSDEALLGMAERGSADHKALCLEWCVRRDPRHGNTMSAAHSARFAAIVDAAARSTDPKLGARAADAWRTSGLQRSVAGLRVVIEQLPAITAGMSPMSTPDDLLRAGAEAGTAELDPVQAADLWQRALRSAERMTLPHPAAGWLGNWLERLALAVGRDAVPPLLALAPRWEGAAWWALAPLVDADNAVAVLQQAPSLKSLHSSNVLRRLAQIDLPRDAAPLLLRLAGVREMTARAARGDVPGTVTSQGTATTTGQELGGPQGAPLQFAMALASTGHPDALPLLRDFAGGTSVGRAPLLFYVRRNGSEAARAAVRELHGELVKSNNRHHIALLLAALANGDPWALDQIHGSEQATEPPYTLADDDGLRARWWTKPSSPGAAHETPLEYLLAGDASPPHRFTLAQVEAVLQRVFGERRENRGLPRHLQARVAPTVRDDVLRLLARYDRSVTNAVGGPQPSMQSATFTWMRLAMQRLRQQGGGGGWAEWLDRALADDEQRYYVLRELTKDEVLARLPQIEAFARGGVGASAALEALERAGRPLDIAQLVAADDPGVRYWAAQRVREGRASAPPAAMVVFLADTSKHIRLQTAQHFGRTLDEVAVPGLLALLRDPDEEVRQAATAALQRIRFCHEQEAHWQKLRAGIDARPEAALEKLLLQARPGEPKARRLLAITALGALGKVEATPYLIDWSADPDAEVAAAAEAAVTQVFLNARR